MYTVYIVDLFEYFSRNSTGEGLGEGSVRSVMADVIKGMYHCHKHSICHRGMYAFILL